MKFVPLWLAKLAISSGLVYLLTKRSYKESQRSLQEVVESTTDNKKLQAVLSYCFGDLGNNSEVGIVGLQLVRPVRIEREEKFFFT